MGRLKLFGKLAAGLLGLSMILNISQAQAEETPAKKIVINSASRIMSLYEGDKKIALYPLGLGKVNTPTPVGYFQILTKEVNPPWINPAHPEYEVPSGPNNPLGYRWMQIRGNYGIHGTNRPDSIGHYVSNGCIRMLEKDVEDVFDKVSIGTPVEITYNRVVVEKLDDGNVVYYIYPDGYRWQPLNVSSVNRWLEPYGVSPFESDEEIAKKIKSSDGQPTYVGKSYSVEVNGETVADFEKDGRKFLSKAVTRDKITYLPAVPLAMTLKTKLEWHTDSSTLKTSRGEVTGYELKRQLYLNSDDAIILFGVDGGLENISENAADGKIFRLRDISVQPKEPAPIEEKTSTDEVTKTEEISPTEKNLEDLSKSEEKVDTKKAAEEKLNAKTDDN